MSDFGSYSGEEFFKLQFPERKFLVDKIMRERDSVLLVGGEKSGKSVLIKQLICSLTTGSQPFLDEFEVNRACKVTYIQLEGELGDTQDRFRRMIKALDFDSANFHILFYGPLALQEKEPLKAVVSEIEKVHKPDVIIIDPLYFACVGGSMSDDEHIVKFTGNMRILKDHFNCALILVHHTHKIRLDTRGQVISEGDNATFGSTFLKAWPDHLLLFKLDQASGIRHLTCLTQRSGDIIKSLDLQLIQPNPLYFHKEYTTETIHDKGPAILRVLQEHPYGLDITKIGQFVGAARSTVYRDIKPLLNSGIVVKNDQHRPVVYMTTYAAKPVH